MTPNIGLTDEQRNTSLQILNRLLSDQQVLLMKLKNYHWHVKGIHFQPLHAHFETLYTALNMDVDSTAERVRALGSRALATFGEYLLNTHLKESPGVDHSAHDMIADLLADFESIVRFLREAIPQIEDANDKVSADHLTQLIAAYEQHAWILRAFLG